MLPGDYVNIQRKINTHHTDGSVEHTHEEAMDEATWICKYIRRMGFKCDSLLDAGCRTGYAMDVLMQQWPSARVVGVDIVPEFAKRADLRGEAYECDMHDLSRFTDGEFDWVFTCTSIEHCHDVPRAIKELRRVARVGIYCHTDLENEHDFSLNPSHFTHHNDPMEWVREFDDRAWWLMRLDVPNKPHHYSRISMVWVRKDQVLEVER